MENRASIFNRPMKRRLVRMYMMTGNSRSWFEWAKGVKSRVGTTDRDACADMRIVTSIRRQHDSVSALSLT